MAQQPTSQPAWADRTTRAMWKRMRRTGRAWLAIGVTCFVGFNVYVTRINDHADRLLSEGVETEGVVLADPPRSLRCTLVPVPIRYPVEDTTETRDLFVSGCGGDGLRKGDVVRVSFDPRDPTDFVVDGKPNESRLANLAWVGAVVASAFFIGAWGIRSRRLHLARKLLKAHAWTSREARLAGFASPWTRGRLVVELRDPDACTPLVTQPYGFSNPMAGAAPTGELLVAGHGDAFVIRSPGERHLVIARSPRRGASQRRAQRALTSGGPQPGAR